MLGCWDLNFWPTNGFSIKPLKVKLLAGKQKATYGKDSDSTSSIYLKSSKPAFRQQHDGPGSFAIVHAASQLMIEAATPCFKQLQTANSSGTPFFSDANTLTKENSLKQLQNNLAMHVERGSEACATQIGSNSISPFACRGPMETKRWNSLNCLKQFQGKRAAQPNNSDSCTVSSPGKNELTM